MKAMLAGMMACALALGAWGCADATSESEQSAAFEQRVAEWAEATVAEPRVLTSFAAPATDAIDQRLTDAVNGFGFALLGEVTRSSSSSAGPANTVLSPFSAHTALAMVANGARGETADEILATLGLAGMPPAETNQMYGEALNFLEFLNAHGQTRVAVVNSMWPDARMEVEPAFVETTKDFFGAQLETVDTTSPEAARRINAWIAEQTGGKITDAVTPESLDPAALTLLSAFDFVGTWPNPFEQSTRDESFHLADGATATVPLMSRAGDFEYAETGTLQAIYLTYYGGGTGMWVVLPPHSEGEDPAASLAEWVGALDAATWDSLTSSATLREGRIDMPPRYSLRSRTDLTAPLQAMGMRSAFDEIGADLSGIAPPPASNINLSLRHVVQETTLAVDEESAEASALRSVATRWISPPERPDGQPFEMIVDRPFLIAIDLEHGPMLFLGAIYDPR